MLRLILIRPGLSLFEEQARIQGNLDIPLADSGREQVLSQRESLAALKPLAIYTAPSAAARETAEILAKPLRLKPKVLAELENLDQGLWQGMLIDEVKHKQTKVYKTWLEQPQSVCPPDGETIDEAFARIESGLEKLIRKHREGVAAVVVSEPLASILQLRLTGQPLGNLWQACAGGCHIRELEIHATEWRSGVSLEVHQQNGAQQQKAMR
jgi:probable phosphoglycerate mutase